MEAQDLGAGGVEQGSGGDLVAEIAPGLQDALGEKRRPSERRVREARSAWWSVYRDVPGATWRFGLVLLCVRGDGAAGGVDLGEDRPGVSEEARAGGREADAARGPLEQARAELVLELADLAADRRLGDVEPPSRATDVLLLGDGHEVGDLREAHALRVRKPGGGGQLQARATGACRRGRAVAVVGPPDPELWRSGGARSVVAARASSARALQQAREHGFTGAVDDARRALPLSWSFPRAEIAASGRT